MLRVVAVKKYLLIAVIIILAAVTVPKEDEYVLWLKDKLKQESENGIVDLGIDLFGSPVINGLTSCKSYVVISLCKTNVLENESITAVGVFANFISLGKNTSKKSERLSTIENSVENVDEVSTEAPIPAEIVEPMSNGRNYIRDSRTGENFKNTIEWTFDDIGNDQILPIDLLGQEVSLILGEGHPNGFRFNILFEEESFALQLPVYDEDHSVIDEYGELVSSDLTVQATTYDFQDKKTGQKILIAISDNASIGRYWVFSYIPVADIRKINPFHLELAGYMQDKIWIEENKLLVTIGGSNRIEGQYEWFNGKFFSQDR